MKNVLATQKELLPKVVLAGKQATLLAKVIDYNKLITRVANGKRFRYSYARVYHKMQREIAE